MKPLYLTDRQGPMQVVLDGPALRVRASAGDIADRRFPLSRVSRVVVVGRVSWSTDALLACADEGVVVCFQRKDGRLRARWIGRPSKRNNFAQRWRDFFDRSDWQELYMPWRTNIRRRAIRFCALRMGWSPRKGTNLVRTLHGNVGLDLSELRTLKKELRGLVEARVIEELTHTGLGADDVSLTQLVPDLVTVVQWALHAELVLRPPKPCRNATAGTPMATAFFERNRGTCDFVLRETLRHLYRYLEEVV